MDLIFHVVCAALVYFKREILFIRINCRKASSTFLTGISSILFFLSSLVSYVSESAFG